MQCNVVITTDQYFVWPKMKLKAVVKSCKNSRSCDEFAGLKATSELDIVVITTNGSLQEHAIKLF